MQCIHADLLYTGRSVERDAYLVFKGHSVVSVAKRARGTVLGDYPVVTPAMIDPHCHIGMYRAGEPGSEGEGNEQMDSILPLPDALDSVQMDDPGFQDSVEAGVLYSCVVPGSGNLIGGQSAVLRNYAASTADALIARAGVKGALGWNPMGTYRSGWKGTRAYTRMGGLALLRARFAAVCDKMAKEKKKKKGSKKETVDFSAEEKILREILAGRERLRVHCHKTDDIASLIRLSEEFALRVSVEHACDVFDPAIFRELKSRRIPVIYGPIDCFAYKTELRHESWRNVRHLLDSGVDFGLMTDHPVVLQRQLLLQLRWFLRCGVSRQDALEIVTRRNAVLLGLEKKLGVLQKNRWASFVCWSGDPFEMTSHPVCVYGEGRRLYHED